MPKHDSCCLSAVEAGDAVDQIVQPLTWHSDSSSAERQLTSEGFGKGPLTVRASTHVMLSPGPSVLVRPVGRHICPSSSVRLRSYQQCAR